MKTKKCKVCKDEYAPMNTLQKVCSGGCALKLTREQERKNREKESKLQRKKDKERLAELQPRSHWYDKLQILVNQYVRYRDKDEPCCTCGTTNPATKYDAGHCFTRGARSDIRFELTNIHKQCAENCNRHGGGRQSEHKDFIIKKYGANHLAELEVIRPDLKSQFPHVDDIREEIKRYRQMLRENGVRPNI